MSTAKDFESQFLESARQELGLSTEHKERHLVALQQAIALGSFPAPPSAGGTKLAWVKTLGTWCAVSAVVGAGLGFAAGYRMGAAPRERALPTQPAASSVPLSVPLSLAAPEPVPGTGALTPERGVPNASTARLGAARAAKVASATLELQAPDKKGASRNSEPSLSEGESLRTELSYLRRAQNALGGGNPQLALGLVRTLDEEMPAGRLLPEREVTRILSLCALERREEARERGQVFLSKYGSTMYADRVRRSCAGEQNAPSNQSAETEASITKH